MAQWVNRLRNNIFINPPPLPLLCESSGALHLAQPGLTAGRLAGRQADEIIDYIYTYPGLRTEFVNTNQHIHSALYFNIRFFLTFP